METDRYKARSDRENPNLVFYGELLNGLFNLCVCGKARHRGRQRDRKKQIETDRCIERQDREGASGERERERESR